VADNSRARPCLPADTEQQSQKSVAKLWHQSGSRRRSWWFHCRGDLGRRQKSEVRS